MRIGAEQTKSLFDEYVRAGFTRQESLELVKTVMKAQAIGNQKE